MARHVELSIEFQSLPDYFYFCNLSGFLKKRIVGGIAQAVRALDS